jgi:carbonic anhydrase
MDQIRYPHSHLNDDLMNKEKLLDTRATCLNCMDGRVQLPVLLWIKENFPVDFVDVITEAGMDGVLANQEKIDEITRSIAISVKANGSTRFFIVGHYDCRGNPVSEQTHRQEILQAVERLKGLWPTHELIGLWVNQSWNVEVVAHLT